MQYSHIILRLRHATVDVATYGQILALRTGRTWLVGDLIGTTSRKRRENFWSHKVVVTERRSAAVLQRLIERCWKHERELSQLVSEGGDISFYLQLNGQENSGVCLDPQLLHKVARIGARLEIEVFPEWSKEVE